MSHPFQAGRKQRSLLTAAALAPIDGLRNTIRALTFADTALVIDSAQVEPKMALVPDHSYPGCIRTSLCELSGL